MLGKSSLLLRTLQRGPNTVTPVIASTCRSVSLIMGGGGVPKTAQVIPGASVSIVLKADQRTGKEVQGIVRDVLTKGDHHRGIKVRLADGRIGRVQRMYTAPSNSLPTPNDGAISGGVAADGGPQSLGVSGTQSFPARALRQRYRDIRSDEPLEVPAEQIDLGAYIVAPKRKGKGRRLPDSGRASDATLDAAAASGPALAGASSATAKCPVCGDFEGDEAAVAHHVSGHFDE